MGRGKQNNDSANYLNSIETKTEKMVNKSFADAGAYWHPASDSGAKAGNWVAIQGISSAIIDVDASTFAPGVDNVSGANDIAIPNGAIVYLNATSLVISSGAAILYKKYPNT
tara:strand:- start:151 stop:486 length:336 start_codon:yes stop_codon:yes gene_type:complete